MTPSLVDQAQQSAQDDFANDFGQTGIGNMASTGSTIDQARQALAEQNTNTATGVTPVEHSSLWQRLLPTAGSIVGGILAAPLDPFTAGLASVAAAGIGGGLGKAAENATEGKKVLEGNDLTAGLEGAAGQGVGKLAGAALSKGGSMLSDMAGNMEEGAANKAASATAQKVYAAIPKGLRQAHNLDGSLDLANNLGIDATNPQNLVDTASTANDILDSAVTDALGQSGPVDVSNYNQLIRDAISGRNSLGSIEPVAASRGKFALPNTPAAKLLQQLEGYGQGIAHSNADPTMVRGLLQDVGKAYADSEPGVTAMTGAKDPVQVATHDAIGEVYNNLKDTLYNRPEVQDAFNNLKGNIQAQDVGGNQLLADRLNTVLTAGNGHQPVLDALQEFGNLRNVGHDALTASKGVLGDVANGNSKIGNLTEGAVNLGGLYEGLIGGHPAGLLAPLVYNAAKSPAVLDAVGGGLSKVGSSALPGAIGAAVGTSPNAVAPATNGANAIQLPQMNQGNSVLDQALYEAMENPLNGGLNQIGALLPLVQRANQAQQAEQALVSNFNTAGGAQGPVGGLLSRLGATFTGSEAASLPAQEAAEAQAIANATGVPAAQVEGSLPKITQNQSAAQASLGNINSLIQALLLENSRPSGGVVAGAY